MDEYISRFKNNDLDALFAAILSLQSVEECYRFFEDVCTVQELFSISQRWDVARMLDTGITYQEISAKLNASTATISRVNRCLGYGAGGYRLMLDRMRQDQKE